MNKKLQLNSFDAFSLRFLSFSPFRDCLELDASSTPLALANLRSAAGKICRSRPWKEALSSSSYALTAQAESTKLTKAMPLWALVTESNEMWIYQKVVRIERAIRNRTKVEGKRRRGARSVIILLSISRLINILEGLLRVWCPYDSLSS